MKIIKSSLTAGILGLALGTAALGQPGSGTNNGTGPTGHGPGTQTPGDPGTNTQNPDVSPGVNPTPSGGQKKPATPAVKRQRKHRKSPITHQPNGTAPSGATPPFSNGGTNGSPGPSGR